MVEPLRDSDPRTRPALWLIIVIVVGGDLTVRAVSRGASSKTPLPPFPAPLAAAAVEKAVVGAVTEAAVAAAKADDAFKLPEASRAKECFTAKEENDALAFLSGLVVLPAPKYDAKFVCTSNTREGSGGRTLW